MLLLYGQITYAQETFTDVDFFGEIELTNKESDDKNKYLGGFLRYQTGINLEDNKTTHVPNSRAPALTKAKVSFNAYVHDEYSSSIKYKFRLNGYYDASYQFNDSSSYTAEQKRAFESAVEMAESYLTLKLPNDFSLSIGRLISAWGQSEASPVVDIVNPRDIREFGQADLEEMRLPVGALKLNYTDNQWLAEFVSVFEFRGNRVGVHGSDFDPYLTFRDREIHDETKPYGFARSGEFYFRLKTYLAKGELAVIIGDGYDKSAILNQRPGNSLRPEYKRMKTVGASGNAVWQAWLTKFEFSYKFNKGIQQTQGWSRKDVVQSMIGVDYSGLINTTITFEWNTRYIKNYTERLLNDKIQHTYALFLKANVFK